MKRASNEFHPSVKAVIRQRARERCEVGAINCWGNGTLFHHRLRRSHGGMGTVDNGLLVCVPCHTYVHEHPAESYERGWMVRSGY